jgi:hypothetical protein
VSSLALAPTALASAESEHCQPSGNAGFVCGLQNPEDLVRIPGTTWIIASGMAPGAGLYLVDADEKNWTSIYPGDELRSQPDSAIYGACTEPPDPESLVTHGLNLRPGQDGQSTLYVVGHGGREAIEVFGVDASGATPMLTWIGCVMTPEAMEANSVASFEDGSLVVTIPLERGKTVRDALAGDNTGAVYSWSPGDKAMRKVEGTELPYANGIEVSADGEEIYVVSSGLFTVGAYTNTNPSRLLRSTGPLDFIPDNLHMDENGRLMTAGLNVESDACGTVTRTREFSLEEFAACARPFKVWEIEPESMQGRALATGPADRRFSNITMAVPVDDELWIGTFGGDRVAYQELN